jgi:ribonucleoside-diphosphate reductase subunit M1
VQVRLCFFLLSPVSWLTTYLHPCSEILEYTAEDEIAVCNLGSLSLPAFVSGEHYDYDALHAATKILARNLDRVIDRTFYPVPEASRSNLRHRPIGLGVQGLADVFFALRVAYDSDTAAEMNRRIFATIYHAAVETSAELAAAHGPYETYRGSPASEGKLQYDLWNAAPHDMYDWAALKELVARHGLRNSLLVAPMPTASTAQILGNTEAFEPVTSNLYSRNTMAGTFTVINKHLLRELLDRGLWTPALKQKLVASEGSVQGIPEIPDDIKRVYKTSYELSMKTLIDMAADRGVYVDQSMSLNMFVAAPTFRKLSSMHFYAWRKGLKTGMYYLRSKAATGATKITVENAECVACSG